VLENVELPFLYRSESRAEAKRRAQRALEKVGLGPRLRHTPNTLSGGEMQRVAIARAIAGDPDLILADEPTGNLDAATGLGILELLGELNSEGATIVLVTHDREVAARAGAEAVMQDGVLEGPAS